MGGGEGGRKGTAGFIVTIYLIYIPISISLNIRYSISNKYLVVVYNANDLSEPTRTWEILKQNKNTSNFSFFTLPHK